MRKEDKKTILLVEDDKQMIEVIADTLGQCGFKVIKAKNGAEGLEKSIEFKPDLIFLDVIMPVMDGITMLGALREDEWGKNAKVVMLSNLSDAENINNAMKNGVFDYLVKDKWSLKDLVKMAKEKLEVK